MKALSFMAAGLLCFAACDVTPASVASAASLASTQDAEDDPVTKDAPASASRKLELREGLALERDGYVKIYGEVANGHEVPVAFVRIDISLFDASGELIAEERTYASRPVVPAGERTPFAFTRDVRKLSGKYDHHRIQVSAKPSPHGRSLEVEPTETKHESTRILTTGLLRNRGDGPCVSPQVVVAGYGADGKVVEVASIAPSAPDDRYRFIRVLSPGETAPFRVSLALRGPEISKVETFGSCGTDMGEE